MKSSSPFPAHILNSVYNMKSSYSSLQSFTNKHESSKEIDYEESNRKELCMQQRRLCRLYGSNAGRIKVKHNENTPPAAKEDSQQKMSEKNAPLKPKSKRRLTVEKFVDRKLEEVDLEIHHNHNNVQAWYSGYQNSSSICGCPQALASR